MATNTKSAGKTILLVAAAAIVGFLVYSWMTTAHDNRTTTDRLGDAVHALPQGLDKAGDQLEDRTPAQKLGDSVDKAGQDMKDDTKQ
jgi:hypothetical protein